MIRHRSAKREKIYTQHRRKIVADLLQAIPICQRCNRTPSQDIHELKSRARGGSIIDHENLVAVCRPCHTWITSNPKMALEEGWSKSSWM